MEPTELIITTLFILGLLSLDKKMTTIIIAVLLVFGIFCHLFMNITTDTLAGDIGVNYIQILVGVVSYGGIILIIKEGTLLKAKPYFQYVLLFAGIAIIGGIFKIMHWPWNNILILLGLLGVLTIYSIRFTKKQEKRRLDFFKLLWIIILILGKIFEIEHWPFGVSLTIIGDFLFIIMFTEFAYQTIKEK